jgi:NOL1/NOP2/fmu family ribosome biogenesis protein
MKNKNKSGAFDMKEGDRVRYIDGRIGVADEFLQDGDALVTWEDGSSGTVKWNNLRKV